MSPCVKRTKPRHLYSRRSPRSREHTSREHTHPKHSLNCERTSILSSVLSLRASASHHAHSSCSPTHETTPNREHILFRTTSASPNLVHKHIHRLLHLVTHLPYPVMDSSKEKDSRKKSRRRDICREYYLRHAETLRAKARARMKK